MKSYRLDVTVEPLEDGRFLALATNLNGCMAEGDTIAEAFENFEDAARMVISYRLKHGWDLPPEVTDSDSSIFEARVLVKVAS